MNNKLYGRYFYLDSKNCHEFNSHVYGTGFINNKFMCDEDLSEKVSLNDKSFGAFSLIEKNNNILTIYSDGAGYQHIYIYIYIYMIIIGRFPIHTITW